MPPSFTGWFKFGGVEFFKIQAVKSLGEQGGWDNRTSIYLGSAAAAETIADIFLCPLEAVRIRLVSEPTYGGGSLPGAAAALVLTINFAIPLVCLVVGVWLWCKKRDELALLVHKVCTRVLPTDLNSYCPTLLPTYTPTDLHPY